MLLIKVVSKHPSAIGVSGGVKILRIYFHGQKDNSLRICTLPLKMSPATVLQCSIPIHRMQRNDIVQWVNELWHVWASISRQFTGITLTDVRHLIIGIGDGNEETPGGAAGTMYFDNIALYPPVCLNQDGDADLTNDDDYAVDLKRY